MPTSPFFIRPQRHRHVVDVGARGSGDDQTADLRKRVVGVVFFQYFKYGQFLGTQFGE